MLNIGVFPSRIRTGVAPCARLWPNGFRDKKNPEHMLKTDTSCTRTSNLGAIRSKLRSAPNFEYFEKKFGFSLIISGSGFGSGCGWHEKLQNFNIHVCAKYELCRSNSCRDMAVWNFIGFFESGSGWVVRCARESGRTVFVTKKPGTYVKEG